MPLYEFLSHIYITRYAISHQQREQYSVVYVWIAWVQMILYNSSVNKKLILCYVLKSLCVIVSCFNVPMKILPIKPQQNYCAFVSNIAVFSFWINPRFERIL